MSILEQSPQIFLVHVLSTPVVETLQVRRRSAWFHPSDSVAFLPDHLEHLQHPPLEVLISPTLWFLSFMVQHEEPQGLVTAAMVIWNDHLRNLKQYRR